MMSDSMSEGRRRRLLAEAALIYGGAPLLLFSGWVPMRALLPLLFLGGLICVAIMRYGADLRDDRLWNLRALLPRLKLMLLLFAGGALALTGFMALLVHAREVGWFPVPPQVDWFILPRERPWLYAALMVGYPLVSVYPQEIIYRGFFFHRYAPAFRSQNLAVVANAVAFGWAHIIFHNPVAVVLTLAGGVFFATTYLRTRSLLAAAAEHSLYGCLLFTLGLGWYFYGGSVQAIEGGLFAR